MLNMFGSWRVYKAENYRQQYDAEYIFEHNIKGGDNTELSQHLIWNQDESCKAECSCSVGHQRSKSNALYNPDQGLHFISVASVFPVVFIKDIDAILYGNDYNQRWDYSC